MPVISKHSKEKKPILIAFDPATTTGWATENAYGTFNLSTRKDESWGMKLIRFAGKLRALHEGVKFTVAAYERPGGRNTQAIITQSKIIGEIEKFCVENSIEYRGYSSMEIKKFLTGKGNAGKPQMIEKAHERFGYNGSDDNEADAIALYHLLKTDLNL